MHLPKLFVATSALLFWLGGCSSDATPASSSAVAAVESTAASAGANDGAAPTVCATDAVGDQPTVTIDVDDDSDGFGRFGLQVPTPLPAGMIRLLVNAVEDNPDPVDVTVATAGATVFEFVQVEPGVQCGADVELAAGDYTVTFGDKSKTFTVGEG